MRKLSDPVDAVQELAKLEADGGSTTTTSAICPAAGIIDVISSIARSAEVRDRSGV